MTNITHRRADTTDICFSQFRGWASKIQGPTDPALGPSSQLAEAHPWPGGLSTDSGNVMEGWGLPEDL